MHSSSVDLYTVFACRNDANDSVIQGGLAGPAGPDVPNRRKKMMLPKPSLCETEFAAVIDGMRRGKVVDVERGPPAAVMALTDSTCKAAIRGLLPLAPVRTPMLTGDRGQLGASAKPRSASRQESTVDISVSVHCSDVTDLAVASTPNPLAAGVDVLKDLRVWPGSHGLHDMAGDTHTAAIDMHGVLGVDSGTMGETRAKRRGDYLQSMHDDTQTVLEALPEPHRQYALAGRSQGVRIEEPHASKCDESGVSVHVLDAVAAELLQQQVKRAVCASTFVCRSQSMQRRLPAPVAAATSVHLPASMSSGSLQSAESTLTTTVHAVITHDAVRYKPCGKTAAKRIMREERLLHDGPSVFEAQHDAATLRSAAGVLRVETGRLIDKYGHLSVPSRDVADLLQVTAVENQYGPL